MQEYIVRQHSVSSFAANWLCNKLSLSHVCFASSAINGDHQRRRRDLNPRAAINDLLPFQGSPFSLLGTSPQKLTYDSIYKVRGEGISSGEGGIRTHAPLRTNGFQDRLVMTTSIPLHIFICDVRLPERCLTSITPDTISVKSFFYFLQKNLKSKRGPYKYDPLAVKEAQNAGS